MSFTDEQYAALGARMEAAEKALAAAEARWDQLKAWLDDYYNSRNLPERYKGVDFVQFAFVLAEMARLEGKRP